MTTKTIEEVRAELNAKIPRDAIETRDSGFGKPLSYLAGHYVIDRLNQVFGPENWEYYVTELKNVFNGEVNGKFYTCYTAQVRLVTRFPNGRCRSDVDVGFGDGQDAKNPGKPHELATKEAVTDALKRCAKSLGMSMGLALYDKAQENVEDARHTDNITATKASRSNSTNPGLGTNSTKQDAPRAESVRSAATTATVGGGVSGKPAVGSATLTQDAEAIKKTIINAAAVLEAKGIIDKGKFKTKHIIDAFGVQALKDLSPAQINQLYTTVKTTYPEIGLQ